MSAYVRSMTEGSELGHIIRFSLPLLLGNLFQQLYNVVDSAIVGKYLGSDKLAAVGSTGSITYLFYTLCIGLATGAGILIAQRFGAKDIEAVKRLIANSAYALGALGVVITAVSTLCAEPLLRLLDTPASLLPDAVGYMHPERPSQIRLQKADREQRLSDLRLSGISAASVNLRESGERNLSSCTLQRLPFPCRRSAALATVIAQGISALGSIIFAFIKNPCFKLAREELAFRWSIFVRCLTTGIPIALQNALVSVSMISLQRTANGFGEDVMAAYTASMRVEQLVQQPFSSLNVAISTFSGQNIGAGKRERAVKGFHRCVLVSLGFSVLMLVLFMLFSRSIVGIFVDEPAVLNIGEQALKLSCLFYFPLGLIHVTRGMLNGAGDVGFALLNGIAEVVGRIGFAAILVNIPAVGHWAVWGTTCLTWVLTAAMSLIRYKSGIWKKKSKLAAVEE